jgi:hypothetical protein
MTANTISANLMPRGGVVLLFPNDFIGRLPPRTLIGLKMTLSPNQEGAMRLVQLVGGVTKSSGVCVHGLTLGNRDNLYSVCLTTTLGGAVTSMSSESCFIAS